MLEWALATRTLATRTAVEGLLSAPIRMSPFWRIGGVVAHGKAGGGSMAQNEASGFGCFQQPLARARGQIHGWA
jgi:hypothetical protein